MSEYDMSIHSNPSAKAWAALYKKTFPAANEELMLTWFANAMMAMHDHLQNGRIAELEQQLAEARQALLEIAEYDENGDYMSIIEPVLTKLKEAQCQN